MIKKFLFATLPALALIGCLNDASDEARPHEPEGETPVSSRDLSSLETPVKIVVGSKSATLYKTPDGFEVVESVHPKGEEPLLTPEMNGKTWKEIVDRLAPGSTLAPEYAEEIYRNETGGSDPVMGTSPEGETAKAVNGAGILAKTAADAGWFQSNYCKPGNSFSWCLLNRWGAWNDWGQTNCKQSTSYIIMNGGSQVTFTIKVGGKKVLTTTILNNNHVYGWTTTSGKDFWGYYKYEQHRYDIVSTDPANGWHWAVNARTW